MNKKKILKILSIVLIVSGILVALFPAIDYFRMRYYQKKLLEAYKNSIVLPEQADVGDLANEALSALGNLENEVEQMTSSSIDVSDVLQIPSNTELESSSETTTVAAEPLNVIGVISIDKLDIQMPIMDEVKDSTLNVGAAHITGTSKIGEIGNCGIAGHRGRDPRFYFYRVDELQKGDLITIKSNGKTYEYTVYSMKIVTPDDISVLYRSKTEKVLTIVTCDPPGVWDNRLIIHALQKP